MSDYDEKFTHEQAIRVEALRLLVDAEAGGEPSELIYHAKAVAEFIAGPESLVPLEWRRLKEVRDLVIDMVRKAGVDLDPWKSAPDPGAVVTVDAAELLEIQAQLWNIAEPPF